MTIRTVLLAIVCAFLTGNVLAANSPNLLVNGELATQAGTSNSPAGWLAWSDNNADPEFVTYRSGPNSWALWWDSGIYQDLAGGYYPGDVVRLSGYLYTPSGDKLSGSVTGSISMEVWSGTNLITTVVGKPTIGATSAPNTWIYSSAEYRLPTNMSALRVTARFTPNGGGSGRFLVDDVAVTNPLGRANLVPNPSFESSGGALPNWSQLGSALQGPEYSVVRSGSNSWMLTGTGRVEQTVSCPIVKGQKIRFGAYLWRNSTNSPSSTVYLQIGGSWYGSDLFYWASPSNRWVCYQNTITAPVTTNSFKIFVQNSYQPGYVDDIFVDVLDSGANLLVNPALSGSSLAPNGWQQWYDGSHDPDTGTFRSGPNAWGFWWDGGIYQDVGGNLIPGFTMDFASYLLNPSWDALRNGAKGGAVNIEFYNGTNLVGSYAASTNINSTQPQDTWIPVSGSVLMPSNATTARLLVRCQNWTNGDGRFLVDDAGICYHSSVIDGLTNPAMYGTASIVQSNPAVAYWEYIQTYTGRLKFARNSLADGSGTWSNTTLFQTNVYVWGAPFPSLQIVAGNPAMAVRHYAGNGDLYYFRCATADGFGSWVSTVVDTTGGGDNCGVDPTLLVVNGKPAISSLSDAGGVVAREIRYYQSATNTGVGAWSGRTLAKGTVASNGRTTIGNMEIVNGKPALVWRDGTGSSTLQMLISTNVDGNGTWVTNVIESSSSDAGRPHLAIVSGRPAVAYTLGNLVRYAINSSAAGNGSWTILTVATNAAVGDTLGYLAKLSMYNGKPCIAYTADNGNYPAVGYALSTSPVGTNGWTVYTLTPGSYVGALLQQGGRPLVVSHGINSELRMTR